MQQYGPEKGKSTTWWWFKIYYTGWEYLERAQYIKISAGMHHRTRSSLSWRMGADQLMSLNERIIQLAYKKT